MTEKKKTDEQKSQSKESRGLHKDGGRWNEMWKCASIHSDR
jgi:hypothetical protein